MYDSDGSDQFDKVNNAHRARWNGKTKSKMGFFGGYTYLIERSGQVTQFRGEKEVGAHNNIKWMNYKAIGVSFAGNMSRQNLTEAQINAGVELIKDIQSRLNIPDENVTPHRLYKATQCPGNNLPDPVWPWLQEQYDGGLEKWEKASKKWASKYVKDIDGFIDSPSPYKWFELIRRAVKDCNCKK